jgi:Flp pilus assembly protein TadB
MTPTEETRLLTTVLQRIERPQISAGRLRWLSIAGWLVLVAAFVVLFRVAPHFGPIIYVVAGVAGLLGVFAAFWVIYEHSHKQWPVLARYLKAEEIKRRLDELKHGNSPERTREP